MSNIDIDQEIKDFKSNQKWANLCPEFGKYLQLKEQLKVLENQKSYVIGSILQINEINRTIDSVSTEIYEILLAEWTPIY